MSERDVDMYTWTWRRHVYGWELYGFCISLSVLEWEKSSSLSVLEREKSSSLSVFEEEKSSRWSIILKWEKSSSFERSRVREVFKLERSRVREVFQLERSWVREVFQLERSRVSLLEKLWQKLWHIHLRQVYNWRNICCTRVTVTSHFAFKKLPLWRV